MNMFMEIGTRMISYLKSHLFNRKKAERFKLEMLRLEFKARYHHFKLLLQSNNNALENMAAMEKALSKREPFGMPFIKAKTTAISVDVYRMIRNLNEIRPEKYTGLNRKFNEIQQNIADLLSYKKTTTDSRLVIPFADIDSKSEAMVGAKMAKLGQIINRMKLKVPDGFVVTSEAYRRFIEFNELQIEINRRFQSADFKDIAALQEVSEGIEKLIVSAQVPKELEDAILEAHQRLKSTVGHEIRFAMRSSAIGEDSARTSFAGQYHSRLNIDPKNIISAYKEIVAGKYSLQAIIYRYNCGLKDEDIAMCVGFMEMLDAKSGGVAYSNDPVNVNNNRILINSTWGLPKSVVDGSLASDQILVSRKPPYRIISKHISSKVKKITCSQTEDVQVEKLDEALQEQASITEQQISVITRTALDLEAYFGRPQDLEWAFTDDNSFFVLQCRPLRRTIKEKRVYEPVQTEVVSELPFCSGGITVNSGSGSGPVKVVEKRSDMLAFPSGSVLVTQQALPLWASLLSQTAAIVTEQGSFAGHLANVAREYGVPAIFSLPKATSKLKNGDLITVDAANCNIYKGEIKSILARSEAKHNLIEDSPVYKTLYSVSRHIVPLNLLDPDGADFRPQKCRTFHDITRFIHEKSVHEIFNFGNEHRFSEKTSKRLIDKVPMQWWVLNLDDGFTQEVKGKYVELSLIASVPMLALWEGIVSVPWDGPPPIDGRGLMSVMFQSTTNRALNSGGRSWFSDRNYFMISKEFCSLTSRLGFHFSTVESIINDKEDESYISFQYKGGAANYHRRLKRIYFLGELLEELGFSVVIKDDALIARMEKQEKEFLIGNLKAIGYLTIHSRQLDMIMSNGSSVNYYRQKFKKDISRLIFQNA